MNIFILYITTNTNTTTTAMWSEILAASENRDGDEYDELGRNYSARLRRQALQQWKEVSRKERKKTNSIN